MSVEFKHTTLSNGLTILGESNPAAHTAAIGFFVRAGTRDETGGLMGVSHFLEHMMFKGTAKRTAADVNRDFDKIGASYNASTSHEVTMYYAHVLPEFLGDATGILADILRPSLRVEDFETEKKVILEEIGMYADRPFWTVYEKAMERYFAGHPLSFRVLGTNETVGALTADQMRGYFAHRYGPDNIIVSLAGRLDFDACVEQLSRECGAWRATGATRNHGEVLARAADETIRKESAAMHYLVGVCPGPGVQDERRYAAAVLSHVLGDEDNGRLYWELVEPGLTEEADFSHHPYDRTGTFLFYSSCRPGDAAEVERRMLGVIDGTTRGFEQSEVDRAVSKIAMDLSLQDERPAGRMVSLGGQWLYLGEYLPMEEVLRKVRAVTPDTLRELVHDFPFQPRTLVRMAPGKGG